MRQHRGWLSEELLPNGRKTGIGYEAEWTRPCWWGELNRLYCSSLTASFCAILSLFNSTGVRCCAIPSGQFRKVVYSLACMAVVTTELMGGRVKLWPRRQTTAAAMTIHAIQSRASRMYDCRLKRRRRPGGWTETSRRWQWEVFREKRLFIKDYVY